MTGPGKYSITEVTEALERAATRGVGAEFGAVIADHLGALVDSLAMNSASFYPKETAPAGTVPVHVTARGRRELHVPKHLSPSIHDFIASSPEGCISGADPVFSMGHLRNLSAMGAATSLWASVGGLGTIAVFDQARRDITLEERSIVGLFVSQLLRLLTPKLEPAAATPDSSDFSHYLDSSRLAAFVCKDLINPLTAMLGYIELLRGQALDEKAKHYLEKLQEQTEKTHQLVMSLTAAVPMADHQAMIATPPPAPMKRPRALAPAPLAATETTALHTVRARVLLVQKNEQAFEFKKSVLSALGTEVMATFSGSDAIDLLSNEDINAVILDDELDGEWPGRKLYAWICEHKPELRDRVLLTVSTRPEPEIQELIDDAHVPHVSKPLQMVELFAGVQQVLGIHKGKMLH